MAVTPFEANEIVTRGNVNNRITQLNDMFLGVIKETELYYNSNGTKSTITLSDTYTNYEYIQVFGKLGGSGVSDIFKPSVVSTLSLSKEFVTVYAGALLGHGFNIGTLTFSDKTVTFGSTNCGQYTVQSGTESWTAATSSNTAGLSVYKIVGYKY